VSVRGEGIVLDEPSVVAVKRGTNRVLNNGNAVGWQAKEMLGKTPGSISAIRPLKDGVISDFEITEAMLSYFIRKASGRGRIIGPRVVIAVPSGITAVEKRAVLDSAERAGARRVYLVEEPMAAGIGAGLPIVEPQASMIVDIGGGTTEVAIMSLADIATCESVRVAGDDFDEAIIHYMKRQYNMTIGEQTAERIKIEIGAAAEVEEPRTMEVRGRNNHTGLPDRTEVSSTEICEALQEPVRAIIEAVTRTLERAQPELAADLVDNGICLVGGGALLRGLDVVFKEATGLDVVIADDPLTCVARGTSIYLENLEEWKATMESDMDDL
jgi:rod shape-determining protein MreB